MDGAVCERRGERSVDELVLLDQRETVETLRGDGDLEVIAAPRAVVDSDLPSRKGAFEESEDRIGGHRQ